MVVRRNAQIRLLCSMSPPNYPKGAILSGRIQFVIGPDEPQERDAFYLDAIHLEGYDSGRYLWRKYYGQPQWEDVTPVLVLLAEISELPEQSA